MKDFAGLLLGKHVMCFSKCETVPLPSRHALLLASCVLFCCVGDEVDNKEKVSQVCEEEDDDDDPENRYIKTNEIIWTGF